MFSWASVDRPLGPTLYIAHRAGAQRDPRFRQHRRPVLAARIAAKAPTTISD
jgi:hypothetical protein